MKKNTDNFKLNPKTSWLKAEVLLDNHFHNKRRKRFILLLVLTALIGTGTWWYTKVTSSPDSDSKMPLVSAGEKVRTETSSQQISPEQTVTATTSKKIAATNSPENFASQSNPSVPSSSLKPHNTVLSTKSVNKLHAPAEFVATTEASAAVETKQNATGNYKESTTSSVSISSEEKNTAELLPSANIRPIINGVEPVSALELPSSVGVVQADSIGQSRMEATMDTTKLVIIDTTNMHKTEVAPFYLPTKNKSWWVGAYGGWMSVQQLLSSNFTNWQNQRNAEELARSVYAFGIETMFQNRSWNFGIGAELTQVGGENNYSVLRNQYIIVDNSYWTYRVDSTDTLYISGNQIFQPDATPNLYDSVFTNLYDSAAVLVRDTSVTALNGVTSWKYLALPISMGYSRRMGKFSYGLQVTLAPAWRYGTVGYCLTKSQDGVVPLQVLAPVRTFQCDMRLGAVISYFLSNRWSMVLTPQWRQQLLSVYAESSGINQRYRSLGATLGVRWRP